MDKIEMIGDIAKAEVKQLASLDNGLRLTIDFSLEYDPNKSVNLSMFMPKKCFKITFEEVRGF